MDSAFRFFLDPVFVRGFSASLHLGLLSVLFVSWLCKIFKAGREEGPDGRFKNARGSFYKQSLVCAVCVSLLNLVLLVFNYFYWQRSGWSEDILVTLLDLALRTLAWGTLSVYLHSRLANSGEPGFPVLLRVWWALYVCVSCYGLVIDLVLRWYHISPRVHYFVSDITSIITGLFFIYWGCLPKREVSSTLLGEPLLNSDSVPRVRDGGESKKPKGDGTVTPYADAGLFSILTFSWLSPLIAAGKKKTLNLEDVPQLAGSERLAGIFPVFRNKLESEAGTINRVTSLSLVKALLKSSWKDIIFAAVLDVISSLTSYVGPYLIETFVRYLNGRRDFKNEGYILVLAFCLAKIIGCVALRQGEFRLNLVGIKARGVLISLIYEKSLTLSCQSKQQSTTGEIVNIMSVDARRVSDFSWRIDAPLLFLLELSLALFLLYKNLGLAAIVAFLATVAVMLINVPIGKWENKFQDKIMESKDKRMKATSEILKNMRILKLQGWEMRFLAKIMELRKTEAGWLRKFLYTFALSSFVFWVAPIFVSAATFGTCIVLGVPLESGKILSSLATFKILQQLISALPDTISYAIQAKVSLDRISSFLRLDDLQPDIVEKLSRGSSDTAIEVVNGNFSWDLNSPKPTLQDIDFKVHHGMKVAICGTVGSGKTTLLSCILGEVPKISGIVKVCGTKAYVSQSPWIQSGKIEENILFGKDMDREKYNMVLEACSLKKDLEILPFGDQTIIGERGINLSGGQKQRIQIARALYQDADIYLFDDPFSAVDAHTGTHLFKECLLGFLSSKTVMYVTHQVEFLPAADLILVMKDGMITQAGKYNDILNSQSDFMELVGAHNKALSALDGTKTVPATEEQSTSICTHGIVQRKENKDHQSGETDDVADSNGQLVQDEEREAGSVGFSVYWQYLTAAFGGALVPVVLLFQILFQLLEIGSNYWMAWASPVSKEEKPPVEPPTLVGVYVALAVGSGLCALLRTTTMVTAAYKTATIFFHKLHSCIFRAPMSFFDATPSGRILNRASIDQSTVDMGIPFMLVGYAMTTIRLLGVIGVMSQVAWQVFIVFIPLAAVSIWCQRYYISSARELSRLVSVCSAPVIQNFSETISGSTTIRSFDQEPRFWEKNMKLIDMYSRPWFHSAAGMEWLSSRLDFLSAITFSFFLFFLVSIPEGIIDPGIAGLAVTYGLSLNVQQAAMIWFLCQMEKIIISVERMLQYSSIPSEPPLVIDENRPDSAWPSHGEVEIHDLQVRYAPHLPLVLRGVTCTFPGGKKTGIVGRTGSGKSTVIQTLFRIVNPVAGQILIDGTNISSIGLHDLRLRLSIIPQDPTMFAGTVRSNLDPLEEYTDEQIWEALDKCQLGDEVRKKEGKLDSEVSENGENWSMGQRQLVCLGRVLLRKSKVLVLDEATASVDTATDNLIQETLGQHFADCTVIAIAHRITSILDSDMVLLLDDGRVEEHDTPSRLLEDKSSSFSQLVAEYVFRSGSSFETVESQGQPSKCSF